LGPQGLLGMLLVVPCAPRVAWIHLGSILGVNSLPRGWTLRVLGSIWAPLCMPFEGPQAPGHASGGFLCPRGGLDPFWDRFWEPKWNQKGANMHPKIDAKMDEIWSAFLYGNSTTTWSQNGG